MTQPTHTRLLQATLLLAAALASPLLSGCIVAGVSSTGGAFIWPGGLGLVVLALLLIFFLRRR